jgi:hypothetical protein
VIIFRHQKQVWFHLWGHSYVSSSGNKIKGQYFYTLFSLLPLVLSGLSLWSCLTLYPYNFFLILNVSSGNWVQLAEDRVKSWACVITFGVFI